MTKNKALCDEYDLSSVKSIFTGAAPLGTETAEDMHRLWPSWVIRQGYGGTLIMLEDTDYLQLRIGMTESSTVVCSTPFNDVDFGSSGSLLPAVQARLVTIEGNDITGYNQPGELLVKSPSVVLGYLNNAKANAETFKDGWLRTGDEAVVRKSPLGHEHIWIVDRIKELIKVKACSSWLGRITSRLTPNRGFKLHQRN